MPDLTLLLAGAETRVDEILATSGCTVGLRRPHDPSGDAVDPSTLAVTDSTRALYATGLAALVNEHPVGLDGKPARPVQGMGSQVVIRDEDAAAVHPRDEVVVQTSRDPALVGREYAVTAVRRFATGIVVVLDTAPVRRP